MRAPRYLLTLTLESDAAEVPVHIGAGMEVDVGDLHQGISLQWHWNWM